MVTLARVSAAAAGENTESNGKVCLVLGAGSGIGAAVARKFAKEGYKTVVVRRSDETKLGALRDSINEDTGGETCRAFLVDATKEGEISRVVDEVELEFGEIDCAVYNL